MPNPIRVLAPAVVLFALSACGGTQSTSAPRLLEGPWEPALTELRTLCLSGCEREAMCLGEGPATAACRAECEADYAASRRPDTPSTRECLWHERAELTCYAALSCESLDAYLRSDTAPAPCGPEDAAAIEACAL